MEEVLPALGAVAVAGTWAALAYLLVRWRGTHDMSISLHAASNPLASRLFAATLSAGALAMTFWVYGWLMPQLHLGWAFGAVFGFTIAAQLVTAWVGDQRGWKSWRGRVHKLSAYSMAVMFLPLTGMLLLATHVSGAARIVIGLCLAYMLGAIVSVAALGLHRPRYLIYQGLYIAAFQIALLSAVYL